MGQAYVLGIFHEGNVNSPCSCKDPPTLSKWGCREKQKRGKRGISKELKCFELCYHPAHPTLFFFLVRIYRHRSHLVLPLHGDWQNVSWIKISLFLCKDIFPFGYRYAQR